MSKEPATIGELIKVIRTERELSVRELANLAGGIHPSAITRIENGVRDPTIPSMIALARGLDVVFQITSEGLFLIQN